MSWWGKLVGGAFGYVIGGPIGAILGAVVGHQLDAGLKKAAQYDAHYGAQGGAGPGVGTGPGARQERVQTAFFTTVFSVMGHISKADGRVSESEIRMARNIMQQMQLDDAQKQFAIDLFRKGKEPDFPLDDVINQFRMECGRNRNLKQMFIEILLFAAYADGAMHQAERHILLRICTRLGFSNAEFSEIERMVQAQQAFHGSEYQSSRHSGKDLLSEAYQALGIDKTASDAEVKKAYRRQMSKHHPDKLVSKGLPEEMIKLANEKTAEIKNAYETIKKARGL